MASRAPRKNVCSACDGCSGVSPRPASGHVDAKPDAGTPDDVELVASSRSSRPASAYFQLFFFFSFFFFFLFWLGFFRNGRTGRGNLFWFYRPNDVGPSRVQACWTRKRLSFAKSNDVGAVAPSAASASRPLASRLIQACDKRFSRPSAPGEEDKSRPLDRRPTGR